MERVLAEELETAKVRHALLGVIDEVKELREQQRQQRGAAPGPATSVSPALLSFSPTDDDKAAIQNRLSLARDQEERAVLLKRCEALRAEEERNNAEVKKLRRENELQRQQLSLALDDSTKEKSGRTVISSLIDTLRTNQDELASQLKCMVDEKSELQDAVSAAEQSTRSSLVALNAKNEEAASLRAAVARSDKRAAKVSHVLEASEAEKASLKFEVLKIKNERNDARRDEAAAQENAAAQAEAARQSDLLATSARDLATASEERCAATSAALQSVKGELSSSLSAFDAERSKMREDLCQLVSSEAEAQASVRTLQQQLGEETFARKGAEAERDGLQESLEATSRGKIEAERSAKRASDDLRVLSSKHDRLLTAQRASNLHAQHFLKHPNPEHPQYHSSHSSGRSGGGGGSDRHVALTHHPSANPSFDYGASSSSGRGAAKVNA